MRPILWSISFVSAYMARMAAVQGGNSLSIPEIIGGLALIAWAVVFFKLRG